jgi:hypothetical protein
VGGEEKCIQGFGGKTSRKGTVWKTYVLSDERIILKWILKKTGSAWAGLIWLLIGISCAVL